MQGLQWQTVISVLAIVGTIFPPCASGQNPDTDSHPRLVPQIVLGDVKAVAYSPTGRNVLTGGSDGTVRLWDAGSGKQVRILTSTISEINAVRFSPDNRYVLSGNDNHTVSLRSLDTGEEVRSFNTEGRNVYGVAFSPNGRQVLAGCDDGKAYLWETSTGKQVQVFQGHTDSVQSVAFSADGLSVMTGSSDKTAILWDVSTGKQVRKFVGHTEMIESVAFSPDGKTVLTGGFDHTARLWDRSTGRVLHVIRSAMSLRMAAFSPDGATVLTASERVELWDSRTGQHIRTLPVPEAGNLFLVADAAFSPNGRYVFGGAGEDKGFLWDARQGTLLRRFTGFTLPVDHAALPTDGRRLLVSHGNGPLSRYGVGGSHPPGIWDLTTGQESRAYGGGVPDLLCRWMS